MEHLSTETLARLVDDRPEGAEAEHLAGCASCAAELEALKDQTEALAALPEILPPKGDWQILEAQLRSEGLLESPGLFQTLGLAQTPSWMRAAAAVFLFLSGAGTGAAFASDAGREMGTLVSTDAQTIEEAAAAVRAAEEDYVTRMVRYQELLDQSGGEAFVGDPAGRYAALEQLVSVSAAAVRQAPADQFLNGVLVMARAERESMARRLGTTSRGNWF